jgi:hypothetical protein
MMDGLRVDFEAIHIGASRAPLCIIRVDEQTCIWA